MATAPHAVASALPVSDSLVVSWRQVALGVVGHAEAPSSALTHLSATHCEHSVLRHVELHPDVFPGERER